MPSRNISLTREQDAFIAQIVESGEYQNASEAFRDALRALQQRRKEDALKLKALRTAVAARAAAIERGEFTGVEPSSADEPRRPRRARTRRPR